MTEHGLTGRIDFGNATIHTSRFGPPEPSMTAEQCVAHGGHCHDSTGESRLSIPPQYQQRCRHCGHVRWAIPQDQYRYIDEMGQPL